MKSIKSWINKKLVFEFISISFAVFLGLLMNQWKENYNHSKLAYRTLSNIKIEVEQNKEVVKEMVADHKICQVKVDSLMGVFETKDDSVKYSISLDFNLVFSTAWETAKLTQAIAYMDLEVVTDIAAIYEYQEYYELIVKNFAQENMFSSQKSLSKQYLEEISFFLKKIIPVEENLYEYYCELEKEVFKDK